MEKGMEYLKSRKVRRIFFIVFLMGILFLMTNQSSLKGKHALDEIAKTDDIRLYGFRNRGSYSKVTPFVTGKKSFTVTLYKNRKKLSEEAYHLGDTITEQGNYKMIVKTQDKKKYTIFFQIKEMGKITAEEIVYSMGTGWNLANVMDNRTSEPNYETAALNPVTTQEMIDSVRDQGFDSVRIPVSADWHTDETYKINEDFLLRTKEIVDYVIDDGMYAVIDIHHRDGTWGDPTYENCEEGMTRLNAYWTQLAEYFKDYDEHVVFEVLNEPFDSSAQDVDTTKENRTVLDKYYCTAVEAIRKCGGNNSHRLIIQAMYGHNFKLSNLISTKLSDCGNIAAAVHIYYPSEFAYDYPGTSIFSKKDQKKLKKVLKNIYQTFRNTNIPVVITEFGCLDKNNEDERNKFVQLFTEQAAEYGFSCFWWDNNRFVEDAPNDSFGLLDRESLTWRFQTTADILTRYN